VANIAAMLAAMLAWKGKRAVTPKPKSASEKDKQKAK
jgi:hypothetical protein